MTGRFRTEKAFWISDVVYLVSRGSTRKFPFYIDGSVHQKVEGDVPIFVHLFINTFLKPDAIFRVFPLYHQRCKVP